MAKIFKRTIDIVFIIIVAVLLLYFGLRCANIVAIYQVETGSMEHGIHVGDYILSYKSKEYHVGEIVTFKYEGAHVTHRIVKINNDKVTTKGDNNNVEDDEISINDIEGKVIYSGGLLNIVINFKYAIICIMLIIYLLGIYLEDRNNNKEEIKE